MCSTVLHFLFNLILYISLQSFSCISVVFYFTATIRRCPLITLFLSYMLLTRTWEALKYVCMLIFFTCLSVSMSFLSIYIFLYYFYLSLRPISLSLICIYVKMYFLSLSSTCPLSYPNSPFFYLCLSLSLFIPLILIYI